MVIGHNYTWEDINDNDFWSDLTQKDFMCFKTRVQDAKACIAGMLVGPHMRTFETNVMQYLLHKYERLEGFPIGVKVTPLKVFPTESTPQDVIYKESSSY